MGKDVSAPILISTYPYSGSIDILSSTNIVLTFNENVQAGSGAIKIFNKDKNGGRDIDIKSSKVSISGNTITIDLSKDPLSYGNEMVVTCASGVIKDMAGNNYAGLSGDTFHFRTAAQDITAPTLIEKSPSTGQNDVPVNTSIVLTFSENIQAGSGVIKIFNKDKNGGRDIDIKSSKVSISGNTITIDLSKDPLSYGNEMVVTCASGVIKDMAGNNYAGLSGDTFHFRTAAQDITAPTLIEKSPSAGQNDVPVNTSIVLTFSENIQAGSGVIKIFNKDKNGGRDIDIKSSKVSISGNTITIDLSKDPLSYGNEMVVTCASGVIKDMAGNNYAGLSGDTFHFRTAAQNTAPTVLMSDHTLQVGQTAQLSSWVSVSDPDGASDIQEIVIIDDTLSGGHLSYNGSTYDAGQELRLSNINDLQNVTYVAGNSGGKDTLRVNARDKTLSANNGEGVTRTITTEAPTTSNTLQVLAENRIVAAARDLVKIGGDRDGDGTTDYGVSGCTPMMKEIMRLSVGPWKGGQGSYDNNLKAKLNHFSDASDDAFTTIYAGNNDVISSSGGIADLAARLRPGDVINYYHSWPSGEDVHSTIVTSVTSDTIMVIDNLGTGGQPVERNILQNSKGETVFTIRNPQIIRFDALGNHNVVDAPPDLTYINDQNRSGINVNDSIILSGAGADTIDGGAGDDTVILAGLSTDYTQTRPDNATVILVKNGVTDTIKNVEHLKFDDTTLTGAVPSFQTVQNSLSGTANGQTVLFQQVNINTVTDPSRGPLTSKVLANGKEVTGIPSTLKEGWKAAATVDLSGKGNTTLFLYGVSNVQGVGAGNGATWSVDSAGAVTDTKMQLKMSIAGWDVAGKANINGIDGDEILWQNAINGYKALWTDINHDGAVDRGIVLSGLGTDTRESIIGVSDINGNGKKEVVLLNKSTNTITLYEATGLSDGNVSTSSLVSYNSYDDLTKNAGSSLTIFPFITNT